MVKFEIHSKVMCTGEFALIFSICPEFTGYFVLSMWNQGAPESGFFSHRWKQLLSSISWTWCPVTVSRSPQRVKWLGNQLKVWMNFVENIFLGFGEHFLPFFGADNGTNLWNLWDYLDGKTFFSAPALGVLSRRSHWYCLFSGHTSIF